MIIRVWETGKWTSSLLLHPRTRTTTHSSFLKCFCRASYCSSKKRVSSAATSTVQLHWLSTRGVRLKAAVSHPKHTDPGGGDWQNSPRCVKLVHGNKRESTHREHRRRQSAGRNWLILCTGVLAGIDTWSNVKIVSLAPPPPAGVFSLQSLQCMHLLRLQK